jgi:MFS family permease
MLYVGRFVTGFCGGAFTVAVPAYVSEVTEDRIRGVLGTVMILMLCTGIEFT